MFTSSRTVSDCSGCYSLVIASINWVAYKQHTFVSYSSRNWKSKIPALADSESGENLLPRWSFLSCVRGVERFIWSLFYKALVLLMRVLLSWPNHLPEASPLIPSPLGIKISADEFGFRLQQLIIIFCTSFASSYFCLAKFQPRINPALYLHHASTWELNMTGENAHPDGRLLVKCTATNLPSFSIQLAKPFSLIHSLCLDNYFTAFLTSLLKPLTLPSCMLPLCR